MTCSSSTIAGDAGVNSGAVTACTVLGTTHVGDTVAQNAYDDFLAACAALATTPCGQVLTGNLSGETLPPGIYCFDAAAAPTGTLTLDGPSDGIWIFKIGTVDPTSYLAPTGFNVAMPGGSACSNNVFWWVARYATLTTSNVLGTLLAGTTITVTGGNVDGRALATGTVTLTSTTVGWPATPVPPVVTGPTGNACPAATIVLTDLGTGEMRTVITPSENDHYVLVTAYAGTQEGPSGFASSGLERDPAQNTCAPP